ncbi:malate/lactate/ureidoglycolate dehydrogenase [Arenibaculum pallidiluteum]|uniref:malate/lactate/ureidoglycolate dehydrogenase n=1 Tax=Arenibaculum pallidiluteum TaxID=2812559 RepID=UPI002E289B09|nr:malate/lactate/ureidoglycolate dehydrogenase [Arenibaculum pallidiluteum]
MAAASSVSVAPDRLERFVTGIIAAHGSAPEEAAEVAQRLVEADVTGHASHGVTQVEVYVNSLRLGHLSPNRHAEIVRDEPPFLVVEGGFGYGQVIAREATDLAISRAQSGGACILALRNAHHIGRVGAYGERCAAAGMIGIFFVNVVSRAQVAPHGGARPRLGTNPICIAVPATDRHPPFLLDLATSAIAANKCRIAVAKGETVAEGLILDAEGRPTTDPSVMFGQPQGALLPFGGHKGFGLALACEILAGALASGLPSLPDNLRPGRVANSALAFVIDPARVSGPEWRSLTDAVLDYVLDTPAAPGFDRVRVAGQPEAEHRAAAAASGVPLDPGTLAALTRLGAEQGLDLAELLGP